jgi:hypothetical protein
MNYLPRGSQNQNPQFVNNKDTIISQEQQSDNPENWENCLRGCKNKNDFFDWLLNNFDIQYSNHNHEQEKQQINSLQNALKNPKKLLEKFYNIYLMIVEKKKRYNQKHKQELKETVYLLNQKIQSQEILINELKRQNEKLRESKSSLLSKLSDRDRDTSNTITSDESRPQRDVLTENFIQLKTQEITSVGHEIFNHLSQINSDLKVNRKREIAKIKYVFSQQIFDKGSQCFTGDNSIGEDKFPQVVEDFTTSILTDLQITEAAKFPEPIPTILKNLVKKGLKLVKEIVNDDPPGHFLIASQGETFNPENHEPVPGCEPSGQIVYTTYPGYWVNNRIIGESLKASVFTEPDKQPEDQEEQPSENNQNHQQPNSIENEQQSPSNQQLKPTSNHQNPVPQPSENNQTHQPPNSTENKQ